MCVRGQTSLKSIQAAGVMQVLPRQAVDRQVGPVGVEVPDGVDVGRHVLRRDHPPHGVPPEGRVGREALPADLLVAQVLPVRNLRRAPG